MNDQLEAANHTATILKELSDIKANLAVNSNETANIKTTMGEIKSDVREIKNNFVTRREYEEFKKEVQPIIQWFWKVTGVIALISLAAPIIIFLLNKK